MEDEEIVSVEKQEESKFLYIGNVIWLDFVNTMIAKRGKPVDLLTDWHDILDWFAGAEAANGLPVSTIRIAQTEDALPLLCDFRADLLAMVLRIEQEGAVSKEAFATLNQALAARVGYNQLISRQEDIALHFQSAVETPRQLLALIAESAAETLAYGDLSLLRKCENPRCVLHFYDTTKNHARRWCSMGACGNRAKAAAHYQRSKLSVETGS